MLPSQHKPWRGFGTATRLYSKILVALVRLQVTTRLNSRNASVNFGRHASSSSTNRWQSRQAKDKFAKLAKVQGLKSRAAYKLLEVGVQPTLLKDL